METIAAALARAVQLHRAGNLALAEPIYRQILAVAPQHVDGLYLLGLLAYQTQRHSMAVDLLSQAAEQGGGPLVQHHLGLALLATGDAAGATSHLKNALELDATQPGWHTALGRALLAARDYRAARDAFAAELTLNPRAIDALTNLGVCHYELEDLDAAKQCFRRMLELEPNDAVGWHNLAGMLLEEGNPEEAAVAYDTALRLNPGYLEAYSNRVNCEQYRAEVCPERLLDLARGWSNCARSTTPETPPSAPNRAARPLRIGFVSPDLCRAPAGYFLIGLVQALRPEDAAVLVYSDSQVFDDLSHALRAAAAMWRDTRNCSDEELVRLVRADRVDILFDLAGHTKGNRLRVFAMRAAGVQITWAGFAGTTGLAAMDYLLADRFHVPQGAEHHYREKILRLPDDYISYQPPHYAPDVSPLPALTNGRVTFAAFHNSAKNGPASIELWARVMAQVSGSQIILKYRKLNCAAIGGRILREFASRGIREDRVVIEGTSPHMQMLMRYNETDIALDSRPYSGGLTTCEALWMGVPVVTLPGRTFAGRHALSHLSNVGLSELVARTEEEYVQTAVALAHDWARLAELRASLRDRLKNSPLCNYPLFADNFLAALGGLVAASSRADQQASK